MVVTSNHYRWDFVGLSTDSKPTPETSQKVCNGSTFYEADTSAFYIYYNDQWYLKRLAGTGTTYIPITLAYISYGRSDVAQNFVDLIAEQGTTPVGGASYAFANTTGLTTLDLSTINFSKVTDTVCMFDSATTLASITWANSVDFGNVETMEGMYRNTTALTSVDLSIFETGQYLESLFNMFAGSGVQTVTLGGDFDTSAVTDFYGMFNSCTSLTSINNLDDLDLTSAVNVGAMFYNCSSLTSLDLSDNASDLSLSTANANYMLAGMTSLQSLDLSGWKSGSDDLGNSNFWTAQSALTTLTLNGNKRLVNGKVSDSIMATFSSKQGDTITNLTINDPVYYTTDGTTAELTNLADIWGGNALTTLEMTGWDLSNVNPAGNPASTSFSSLDHLTTLTIGDFTLPTDGVNLAMIIGVENTGNTYTSAAPLLENLHLTGDTVMKVYNSGLDSNKSENVFVGNPIGNGTGRIYVPANLVNSYKSDSFWSNYSAIIVAED